MILLLYRNSLLLIACITTYMFRILRICLMNYLSIMKWILKIKKYCVYPEKNINYEFVFGPLVIHENGFGIDLRPANPFSKSDAEETESCCAESSQNIKFCNYSVPNLAIRDKAFKTFCPDLI